MFEVRTVRVEGRVAGKRLRWLVGVSALAACVSAGLLPARGQTGAKLVAEWKLNDAQSNGAQGNWAQGRDAQGIQAPQAAAKDSVSGSDDPIEGNYRWVRGADGGGALQFDGFSTLLEREAKGVPLLHGSFSVEAWIEPESYPWSWLAIAEQKSGENAGFSFGLDQDGHIGLQVSVWSRWEQALSDAAIPMHQWTHVAAVYDELHGISLYINGQPAGGLTVRGRLTQAVKEPLSLGRNLVALPATALVRPRAAEPVLYSFDGDMEDLRLFDGALTGAEVAKDFSAQQPIALPKNAGRHWPSLGAAESPRLQAAYTSLKLYPQWDALWRTGPAADVVVSFPDKPIHYVFWRGSNYGECMVTENGTWIGDQSFESSTKIGTAEHMNDKQDRWSHISVLESGGARVVLHWHYALVDVAGNLSDIDPLTGWGNIADEYFYIYPDGVAVRNGTIHGTKWKYGFTEPMLLLEPGQKPEQLISLDAATIENAQGQAKTYSWKDAPLPFPFPDQPAGGNIAIMNTLSKYKPFYLYMPGVKLGPYGWPPENRLLYSHFPVWDHWPVNQIPSDGRFALHEGRFSSAAVMSPDVKGTYIEGPGPTKTEYFLFGLSDESAAQLAVLDRSWLDAPAMTVEGGEATAAYDPGQRAYVVTAANAAADYADMTLSLAASEASPMVNAAVVVRGWGDVGAEVSVDGRTAHAPEVLLSRKPRLEGDDLIVWIEHESTRPVRIRIRRVAEKARR